MTTFDRVITEKREISKDQFLRKVLIKLASHYDTPTDVCNAKFGDIRESVYVKDKRSNTDIYADSLIRYKIPYYEVEFMYNGKKYLASGFACVNPNVDIKAELPPNNVNIQAIVDKEVKHNKIATVCLWIGFVISFILAAILSNERINFPWVWILVPIMLVVAIVVLKKGNKKYNALMKKLISDNKKQKLENLMCVLKSRNYDELTKEELSLFN